MNDLDERDAGAAVDLLGSGIATVAGAAGGSQVGKEAAAGAAVGAASARSSKPCPSSVRFCTPSLSPSEPSGARSAGARRDTYHPSALQAAICLLLCHLAPGMIYAGFDTITTETKNAAVYACRLARYWRLLAGLVKFTGPLYNPRNDGYRSNNLPTDTLQKQPYIESTTPDPQERSQTSALPRTSGIWSCVWATNRQLPRSCRWSGPTATRRRSSRCFEPISPRAASSAGSRSRRTSAGCGLRSGR